MANVYMRLLYSYKMTVRDVINGNACARTLDIENVCVCVILHYRMNVNCNPRVCICIHVLYVEVHLFNTVSVNQYLSVML